IIGARVLTRSSSDKGETVGLYDPLSASEVWRQSFPSGSILLHSADPGMVGMVNRDGNVRVLAAATGKALFEGKLDQQHFEDAVHVLADRDMFYFAIQR